MEEKVKGVLTDDEIGIIWRRWAGSDKPTPMLQAIDEVNAKCKKKVDEAIDKICKEAKKYHIKMRNHRCRNKTGNWCLDCEIAVATGTGLHDANKIIKEKTTGVSDTQKP